MPNVYFEDQVSQSIERRPQTWPTFPPKKRDYEAEVHHHPLIRPYKGQLFPGVTVGMGTLGPSFMNSWSEILPAVFIWRKENRYIICTFLLFHPPVNSAKISIIGKNEKNKDLHLYKQIASQFPATFCILKNFRGFPSIQQTLPAHLASCVFIWATLPVRIQLC